MSDTKRLDQILFEMLDAIEMNYNIRRPVLKITLTHEAFDAMVIDMARQANNSASYTPAWMNDFEILGIRFEARRREDVK